MSPGLTTLLLLGAGVASAAQESAPASSPARPVAPEETAERFLDAFRARDERAMAGALNEWASDRFAVADALLGPVVAGGASGPGGAGERLDAAFALAGFPEEDAPPAEPLRALVQAWKAWGEEDRAREARLREALARARAAIRGRDWGGAVSAAEAVESDRAASTHGVTAVVLRLETSRALAALGRRDEARRAGEEARDAAERLGWISGRARAVHALGVLVGSGRDPREEVAFHEAALALAESAGDRRLAARISKDLGAALLRVRDHRRALEVLRDARKELLRLGEREDAMASLGNRGWAHLSLGEKGDALACWEEAAAEAESLGHRLGACAFRANAALQYLDEGDASKALEVFEAVYPEQEALGDRANAAQVLSNVGQIRQRRGDLEAAVRAHERALDHFRAVGDRAGETKATTAIGAVRHDQGDFAGALDLLERGAKAAEEAGDPGVMGDARAALGRLLVDLGRFDAAREILGSSLAFQEKSGDRVGAARTRSELGNLHLREDRFEEALEFLSRAREDLAALGRRSAAARALTQLAVAKLRLGRGDEALADLTLARETFEASGARLEAAAALNQYAFALHDLGRFEEALEPQRQAQAAWEALGHGRGAFLSERRLADLAVHLENPREGLRLARRSVETGLALGAPLGEEESPGLRSDARGAAEVGVRAAAAIAAKSPEDAASAMADGLWFSEAGRGLSLAQELLHRDAFLETSLPAPLRAARAEAAAKVERRQRRLAALAAGAGSGGETLAAAKGDLEAAYRELEEAVSRIHREARRVAEVAFPRPVALEKLREGLRPNEAFVSYQLGEGSAFALVVAVDALRLLPLGPGAEIARKAGEFVEVAGVPASEEAARAADLYERLLRPLEVALAGKTRLVLCPDGVLNFLPFEALARKEGDRVERAIERWEFAYAPSGTVHSILLREARGLPSGERFVALGDPVYPGERAGSDPGLLAARESDARGVASLRRLPQSAAEVRALGDLFPEDRRTILLRDAASSEGLEKAIGRGGGRLAALHLACHGTLDAQRPRLTGLVLSDGEVLSLDRVYRLEVPADLVVLSACDTGRGKLLRGEGVVGLVRGFLFAGASRVVVSNWKVADESARSFMVAFYRGMLERGLAPGAALRAAKIERIRAGGPGAHPAHWAAFVLWGLP